MFLINFADAGKLGDQRVVDGAQQALLRLANDKATSLTLQHDARLAYMSLTPSGRHASARGFPSSTEIDMVSCLREREREEADTRRIRRCCK